MAANLDLPYKKFYDIDYFFNVLILEKTKFYQKKIESSWLIALDRSEYFGMLLWAID